MTPGDDVGGSAGGREIAGWPAAWNVVRPDVRDESGQRLPAGPVGLYTLRRPEESIDAAALLREPVLEDPPYWALVWTGAQAIAAVVAENRSVGGRRTLDLGCGLGLSGLAAAATGADVTFGDYLEDPLDFVRATLARSPKLVGRVASIDFCRPGPAPGGPWDLILAADIVYDPAHYEPLGCFLDTHLDVGGSILLTESLRADAGRFLEGMRGRGFSDRRRPLWVLEDGRRERTWLHELRRTT